ncbi:MAG: ChbG/HpnK family deacetylase [Acidobacteria bacterium]|nr:ChbG/HpnK family deacetylase [Acidobacteriota bacterium]MCA1610518.1 ChbG/HpnK family deacetylase [Acidobacteriota bacterium]MCA1617484.1 ChbG/HpnK family deacetylase [Acidobacteriota bacterium]
MIRLIVNADDYGRTAGINEGTIEAHLRGIVTSATVMILEGAAPEGVRLALRRAPRLSLGLHCVLTGGGFPASDPARLPTLAPGGRLARNADALPSFLDQYEIHRELSEQIARFESVAGRPPSHLDSHHHSALHPSIQPVFAALAAERGLPVRASSPAAGRALRAAGLRTPDRFLDGFYAEGATAENLRALIAGLAAETAELMCHPGYPDAELLAGSTYASERAREVDALCDPSVRALLRDRGVELAAFDAL